MASQNTTDSGDSALSLLFKSLWETYLMMENSEESTGSDKIQGALRKCLASAEQAIFMVNQLQLFSENEEIEEVATNEIKYMLLPALLAYFHSLNTHASRLETVNKAKSHYRDFLRMCKSYKVMSGHIPLDPEEEDGAEDGSTAGTRMPDLRAMASQRQSKIERFRQSKVYESRLKELSEAVEKEAADDEAKREFYLTQVKKWINKALDEIDCLNSEMQILQHMAQMKKQGASTSIDEGSGEKAIKTSGSKAFRPFILTKDKIQKQVFGAGYPSIPTLSIEEFYQQKVQDGTFSIPHSEPSSQSLQGRAANPERATTEMEREDALKEQKEEEDDPELLQRARNMDEFKDDHRRGWGNRQNMG